MSENLAANTENGPNGDIPTVSSIVTDINTDKTTQYTSFQKKRKRRQSGVLRYPLESLTEHTDYLQIDIEEYVALGGYASNPGDTNRYVTGNYFGSDRAGRRSSNRLSKKPLINAGTILLPVPSNPFILLIPLTVEEALRST